MRILDLHAPEASQVCESIYVMLELYNLYIMYILSLSLVCVCNFIGSDDI